MAVGTSFQNFMNPNAVPTVDPSIKSQIESAYATGDYTTASNLLGQANITADQANNIWGSGVADAAINLGINFAPNANVAPLTTLQNAASNLGSFSPQNILYGNGLNINSSALSTPGLTPELATSLMQRSMTTGVPASEFDKYGGYDAVSKMYTTGGGTYSLSDIPTDTLNQYAATVGSSGVGNLGVLPLSNSRLSDQALTNMQANGIDQSTIDRARQLYQVDLYNTQLAAQTDPLKSNLVGYLEDNNISWDEATAVQAYQDQWHFTPEDISRVTGFSLPTVNKILGSKNTIIGNQISANATNPLAIANFANQNHLSAKDLANASGGTLTEAQAQSYLDKSGTYQGRLELAAPEAYNWVNGIIERAVHKDNGGVRSDWMYEMFIGLNPTETSTVPKQLEMNAPTTKKATGLDHVSGGWYEYDVPVPAMAKGEGVEPIYVTTYGDGDSTTTLTGYRVKVDSDVFKEHPFNALYATYDETGKHTGYESNRRIYTGDRTLYAARWNADGTAAPQFIDKGPGGLKGFLQDIGPVGNIALAVATSGMSIEYQIAAQAALQVAQGVPLDKALLNAAASYAGAQVVNIPAIKDIVSGIDSVVLQRMINSGISSATAAGILGRDPIEAAMAGATGSAVASVVGNLTKDLGLTPTQTSIVNATATVFTKAKLSGASDTEALMAAINAGGMATAKSVVKGLKAEKSAGLDISDDTVASLDNGSFQYDPTLAEQVINEFRLATTTPSVDPGVDVAGPGGFDAAAISGMTPMLGITGETNSKIVYNSTEGRYERDITGTTKDGEEYTYKAYYYDDPIKGANVWYQVPGGEIDPVAGGSTVESRIRPTFDTDATSTDISTAGTSIAPTGGTTQGAPNIPGAVSNATNGVTNGSPTGQPGGVAVNGGGPGGSTGGVGPGGGGTGGGGTGGGGTGGGGTDTSTKTDTTTTKTETPTKVNTTTVAPTDPTKTAISAPSSGGGSSSSGYGALPGMLAATSLAAGPVTQGKKIMSDLHQLYPQIANIDPKLLAMLSGASIPQRAAAASNVPNTPQQAAPAQAPAAKSSNPLSSLVGMMSGKVGGDGGFSALSAAGLQMLGGGQGALPAFAAGGTVDHKPEFITGATGHYVKGGGDGQSDSIPAMLADGEYVFDADTVAALGNGSSDAGAKLLDKMRENIRKHKRSAPANKIPPKAKSPLEYLKG